VGIGLNAVVFTLVDTALFRPLPFEDAERIVHVYPAYRDMAANTGVFAGVAAISSGTAAWERAAGPVILHRLRGAHAGAAS
jgi:hypothetical protein